MPDFKQITLFGASGFIGSALSLHLAQSGVTVRAATREPGKLAHLQALAPTGKIVPVTCQDLSERDVGNAIAKSDGVINLLGILYETKAQTFEHVHVRLARRIARITREREIEHLVHMSALNVSPKSKSAYSRSKAEGELAVREKFPCASILRPSIVFGPEDNFFNKFNAMARFSPFLPCIGGGATKFQPVYVGDVVEAALKCLALPFVEPTLDEPVSRIYELGGPTVYSFNGLMRLMLKAAGKNRLLVSVPWGVAGLMARVFERLPQPPLTRDQLELLRVHSILANPNAKTLADLGITPKAAEDILPTYLAD